MMSLSFCFSEVDLESVHGTKFLGSVNVCLSYYYTHTHENK